MTGEVDLLPHQIQFFKSRKRFVALCGGFGCGKSYGLGAKAYALAVENAGHQGALISRSSKQLWDFLLPEVETFLKKVGAPYKYRDGNKLVLDWGNSVESVIHLLSAENDAYKRWAGGNWAWACIDEIDTMSRAKEVWSFVNDRIRVADAPLLQTACASTPEGYGFLWNFFDKEIKDNPALAEQRELIRGCTFDNPNLNVEYVRSQIQTRDPMQLKAYVYGEFVNLDGAVVYYRFDSEENATTKTLADFPQHVLHIGMDFNKQKNPCVVHVVDKTVTYALDEIYGLTNIDNVISEIRRRYPNRQVYFYPDASGFEAIQQLERAFGASAIKYRKANPRVERRVAAVNQRLSDHTGIRRYYVNKQKCPILTKSFMMQVYDSNGAPDKTADLDHAPDATGYFVYWNWPIEGTGSISIH